MCTKPMLVVLHRTIRVNYFATFEDFRFIRETESGNTFSSRCIVTFPLAIYRVFEAFCGEATFPEAIHYGESYR